MGKYFGTDGFRGEANLSVTAEQAFLLGRFLGGYLRAEKEKTGCGEEGVRAVIGKDTRRSSYMFEYALAAGLTASGADAYLLHVTTTPSVSFVTRSEGFDCGIMISASHNPYSDNGIKLLGRGGEKMEEGVLRQAEEYLDLFASPAAIEWEKGISPAPYPHARGREIGRSVDFMAGRNRYIGYLLSLATFSLRGRRIGLDCANGSAWSIARAVYDALGATTYVIGAQPNGTNINEHCGSTHPEQLQALVREKGLDAGFAFDGDADRCIAVDERGEVVDGDGILYICAQYLKERGELCGDTVVGTVMANRGLVRALAREGISFAETPVGDKYVYEYMNAHGCCLGGEPSGHIIFSKFASTGDGILTSLMLMEVMQERKSRLSALAAPLVKTPLLTRNVRVKDPVAALADPALGAAAEEARRQIGDGGRLLLRASGTEPVVRITVESESEELCRAWCEALENVIRAQGYGEG